MSQWNKAQEFERDWWSNCQNTFGEEAKQLLYAQRMGLTTFHDGKSPYNFDMEGKSVLDVGGGPCSLLLKCHNVNGVVIDPCDYPKWIKERYKLAGIEYEKIKGENLNTKEKFDLVFIYNVLQHVDKPDIIIKKAKRVCKEIRLFEWINTGISEGHPHELTEKQLNKWLGGKGKVEEIKGSNTCWGTAYYGIFKGDLF